MKNLIVCLFFLPFFVACDCKEKVNIKDIPACVKAIYEPGPTQDSHLIAVKRMEVGNEFHYWLNTGDNAFDGTEYIINEACDTVCSFCFCPVNPCISKYENGEWEVVYEN